jgi:hypothetical protein
MATPSWPKAIETNETELRPLSETQVPQPFTPVLQDLFGERFSAHISVPGCGSLSARQSCNVLPRCGPIAAEGNWRQYTFVAGHGLPGPARSDRFFREQDAKDSHCATQGEGRACGKARRSGKGKGGGSMSWHPLHGRVWPCPTSGQLKQMHSTPFACSNSLLPHAPSCEASEPERRITGRAGTPPPAAPIGAQDARVGSPSPRQLDGGPESKVR